MSKARGGGPDRVHLRFHVVALRAAEPLKPHAAQPVDVAQLCIFAD